MISAQTTNYKLDILVPQRGYATNNIFVNGFLDSYNTTTKFFWDFERKYEPLKKISIINNSTKKIVSPRISVNHVNFYDERKILDNILSSSKTLIDSLMAIYTFTKSHIIPHFHADAEVYDKYKAIFQYGYGVCSAYAVTINYMLQALNIYSENILLPHHHTIQAVVNRRSFLFDGYEEVFYKDLNNNQIVGFNDVYNDKFLIKRTRHITDRNIFNSLVYDFPNSVPIFRPQSYQLDFKLKPGEMIVFDYSEPTLYHQRNDLLDDWMKVYLDDVKDIISNSLYSYHQNFLEVDLNYVLDDTLNITTNAQDRFPNLHPRSESVGEFSIEFDLPFPVLDINIKAQLQQATLADSILIYYSTDNMNWKCIHKSQQTGSFSDSINLYDEVAPLNKDALYRYFLKFQFHPNDSAWACGIDLLEVKTTFQCSRFFLPKFKLGENLIEYTDANGDDPDRNVEVIIEWQESWENKPPNKVTAPTFPLHQANVDSLYFAFTWEP